MNSLELHSGIKRLVFFVFTGLYGFYSHAQPKEVEVILSKHFEAVGGKETWEKLRSFEVTQTTSFDKTYYPGREKLIFLANNWTSGSDKTIFSFPEEYTKQVSLEGKLVLTSTVNSKTVHLINHLAPPNVNPSTYDVPADLELAIRDRFLVENKSYIIGVSPLLLSGYMKKSKYGGIVKIADRDCHKLIIPIKEGPGGPANEYDLHVYIDVKTYLAYAKGSSADGKKYAIYSEYFSAESLMIPKKFTNYNTNPFYVWGENVITTLEINGQIVKVN